MSVPDALERLPMTVTEIMMQTPPAIFGWLEDLQSRPLEEVVREPERTAMFCVDMTVGACRSGAFASKRVNGLVDGVADLLRRASAMGVRQVLMVRDAHRPDCPEFRTFPRHCVEGTAESQVLPELLALPCARDYEVVERNSLHPGIGTPLDRWLDEHRQVRTAIVVGGFTDLSVYQTAMHLRLRANALNLPATRVIVPANLVDTYNWSDESALNLGFMPHPGDFFNQVFLYHMALNGIQVVRELT